VPSPAVEGLAEGGLPAKEDESKFTRDAKKRQLGPCTPVNARRVSRVPIYMNV
jgi:hypothetical protein